MAIQLEDGSSITIRPISVDDRQALAEGFERLSPESRYRRFFTPVTHLSERELDYLTNIDHHDHEALVAIDANTGEGIAVARYIRIDANAAEPAIAVTDEWQRRGVASALLDALAERAREEGIRRFVAPVLADNAGAIRAFRNLGATSHEFMGPEVELTTDLSEPEAARPALRELLRVAASGLVEPARNIWELFARRVPPPPGFGEAIVVGIEDAQACEIAVSQAQALARQLDLPVHLVAPYRPLLDDAGALQERLRDAERRLREGGVSVSARVQRGDPALVILSAALRERAGLIVLGSPAPDDSRASRMSLWNAVAHNSNCNVLIARDPSTRAGLRS
jgi:nucleotide-binding universal stress UspA family protein/GNAT superfamily N-acetyltransferase